VSNLGEYLMHRFLMHQPRGRTLYRNHTLGHHARFHANRWRSIWRSWIGDDAGSACCCSSRTRAGRQVVWLAFSRGAALF
jgi:hypothetical protein